MGADSLCFPQPAVLLLLGGLFRLSSSREFVFPRLICVSLEHRPAQPRARQSETTLQFVRQMAFCYLLEVEMTTGRLAVMTPVKGAMRNIK